MTEKSPASNGRPPAAHSNGRAATVLVSSTVTAVRRQWVQALNGQFRTLEAADLAALQATVAMAKPGVLLLDGNFPHLRRMSDLEWLRQASAQTAVIVLADSPNDHQALAALRMGARGYCAKDLQPLLLRRAVEKVLAGELWVSRRLIGRLLEAVAAFATSPVPAAATEGRLAALTPRQREVACLVAQGHSNKSIAVRLAIAEATVKAHLTSIFKTLGGPTRVELALHVAAPAPVSSLATKTASPAFVST